MSKVVVDFDPQKIYGNIQKSTDVALYEVAEKVIEDTEQFVPMKTGALRQSATIEGKGSDHITISYSRVIPNGVDIADLLYEGKNARGTPVQNWTTPGTGGYWLEISEDGNLDSWIEHFKQRTREIWRKRKSK
ncbi:MAG: hypothetical protein J5725_11955 [Bacteroidales bacterium]|nr:hypothetical protein [Bacteroidales bacterium]